ncbi:hypothetical protein PC129_g16050 [Phytophthora cactorum]|uniref:Uncharacterized protein n=1 Tax=Phytophthora cactorum TaxID=29920 RepID=A0A8T1HL58_9STRA|nr:hypothetical protein PC114_g19177 [Phytophthora cactorum]KAG3213003.1 hypothetical protein PC129_g16050 [Phytophthora cactorum]
MDAEQAPAANPDQLSYEETLERWALYDYSAFENPRSDDEMRDLFQRWRATRSKPVTVGGTVTPRDGKRHTSTCRLEPWHDASASCRGKQTGCAASYITGRAAQAVAGMEFRDPTPESGSVSVLRRRCPIPSEK